MKITINGPEFSPKAVSLALEQLERDYNLKIRDVTLYARFVDKEGKVIEPKIPGIGATEIVMTINDKSVQKKKEFDLDKCFEKQKLSEEKTKENYVSACLYLKDYLNRTTLTKREIEYVQKWIYVYKVTLLGVDYALAQTFNHCGKVSIAFTNALIESWVKEIEKEK